jgi:hypothetical protein
MTIRIENNNLGLDEVVMDNCFFHLERMNEKSFWIGIDNKEDGLYHINIYVENGKLVARIEKE